MDDDRPWRFAGSKKDDLMLVQSRQSLLILRRNIARLIEDRFLARRPRLRRGGQGQESDSNRSGKNRSHVSYSRFEEYNCHAVLEK
jgi:hypothetical protein